MGENILRVLDALGEKIANLELSLQCEKYRNEDLEKRLENIRAYVEQLEGEVRNED